LNPRILRGFLWGVVATIAMTTVHILIFAVTGRLTAAGLTSEMLPEVIIIKIAGPVLPVSIRVLLAMVIHFGYGGFWGGVLFALTPRVVVWKGIAMGAFLYLIMQVFLFPFLGRGLFGSAMPHRSVALMLLPVATHFTYGAILGFLGSRNQPAAATA